MFGSKHEVGNLLKEKFPFIILWYCASHGLELFINDVKEIEEVGRFIYKLCCLSCLYKEWKKTTRVCNFVEAELFKIGEFYQTGGRFPATNFCLVYGRVLNL